jgi:SAM-dependent methyltransferase
MKATKDNFSEQAASYARYRPTYPEALYTYVLEQVPHRQRAWDCGTGNGQVAVRLAENFEEVYATDISEQQLAYAIRKPNIHYLVSRAEQSPLPAQCVQLVTVAQAIHWFDLEHFYKEVRRVAEPGAVVAAWCYGMLEISPELDEHLSRFYFHTLGPYWDKERQLIDEGYSTIPFPFEEFTAPAFSINCNWDLHDLTGYLNSWSSVRKYIRARNEDPVTALVQQLKPYWEDAQEKKPINFPLHMRIGRVV